MVIYTLLKEETFKESMNIKHFFFHDWTTWRKARNQGLIFMSFGQYPDEYIRQIRKCKVCPKKQQRYVERNK